MSLVRTRASTGWAAGWLMLALGVTAHAAEKSATPSNERSLPEILVAANSAYEAGDFVAAIGGYENLLQAGSDTSGLHYNLGNALLRNGQLGRAIASYRRARSRAPRNQDVLANLQFARQSTKDDLAPPEATATQRTLFFWHYALSRDESWTLLLVGNLLLWSLGAVCLWRRRFPEWCRWTLPALVLPTLAVGLSLATHLAAPTRLGVVVPPEVNAHAAMTPESVVRFVLHTGSEVRIEDDGEEWLRVFLPDGQQGWLQRRYVEVLKL